MRKSIYIDDNTALFIPYLAKQGETLSAFLQRMIREAAEREGLVLKPASVERIEDVTNR